MKTSKRMLSLLLSVMILVSGILAVSVTVFAAGEGQEIDVSKGGDGELAVFDDMTKVTGTWDGNKERQFDGKKLKITDDVSGNITGLAVTNVPAGVYKVGYFLTINTIKNHDNPPTGDDLPGIQDYRFRANPYGMYSNNPYYPCEFGGVEYEGLSTVVGKKIMIVTIIKVNDNEDKIELVAWPRSGYMDATLDKIVFASADHNFNAKNYPGYELFKEAVPEEGDDAARKPSEDEWTPSKEEAPSNNEDPKTEDPKTEDPKDENKDDNKQTGDVNIYMILTVAIVSTVGLLVLRKKRVTE